MDNPRLTLNVSDAAKVLGISRGLAYQMVREGKLPAIRFGKRLVVPKWAIEHLLQEPQPLNPTPAGSSSDILGKMQNANETG